MLRIDSFHEEMVVSHLVEEGEVPPDYVKKLEHDC